MILSAYGVELNEQLMHTLIKPILGILFSLYLDEVMHCITINRLLCKRTFFTHELNETSRRLNIGEWPKPECCLAASAAEGFSWCRHRHNAYKLSVDSGAISRGNNQAVDSQSFWCRLG